MAKSTRTLIKKALVRFPGFQALCRRLTRDHVRVLMYHRFCPEGEEEPRRLPGGELDRQLAYLARHHAVVTPDDQLDLAEGKAERPDAPMVVLTVDDGYADFAEVAYPILKRHGLPATLFVTTGFVEGDTWFWWDRLLWLLTSGPQGARTYRFAGEAVEGDTGTEAGLWRLWNNVADHLSRIDDDAKEKALIDLSGDLGVTIPVTPPPTFAPVTWEQIRDMAEGGVTCGAHTVHHPVLSRVDQDRAAWEISESGTRLAEKSGVPSGWFCYPQGGPGDFHSRDVDLVRDAGYRGCYAAYPDSRHDGDPLTLPRYSVSGDYLQFQWILCGAEHLMTLWQTRGRTRKGPDRHE